MGNDDDRTSDQCESTHDTQGRHWFEGNQVRVNGVVNDINPSVIKGVMARIALTLEASKRAKASAKAP